MIISPVKVFISSVGFLMTHIIRQLTDEIKTLRFWTGFDMKDHLTKMFIIRRQLKEDKYEMHDIDLIRFMVDSLPKDEESDCRGGI